MSHDPQMSLVLEVNEQDDASQLAAVGSDFFRYHMFMKPVLLCLHGWGGSKESFTELREALKGSKIEILTPDLPGFGDEPEPKKPWTVDDYADWVEKYTLKHAPSKNVFLLGHSHGGRIALKLAHRQSTKNQQPKTSKLTIDHLFLCAAAGIRHPRHFKRLVGLTLAKSGKVLLSIPGFSYLAPLGKKFLYKLVRVHDYEKASKVMGQTLINVTREDLRPILKQIDLPTDIFWGIDDHMTPFSDAKIMEKEIKGSKLHTYKGVRHRVHRDKAKEIAKVIQARL